MTVDGRRCAVGKYALNVTVENQHYDTSETDVDKYQYINDMFSSIRHRLENGLRRHRCIKYYRTIDIRFHRTTPNREQQQTTARFRTIPTILSDVADVVVEDISSQIPSAIDNFNRRGSSWLLHSILSFHLSLAPYRPTHGSSFISTPPEIARKNAVVNVHNPRDGEGRG